MQMVTAAEHGRDGENRRYMAGCGGGAGLGKLGASKSHGARPNLAVRRRPAGKAVACEREIGGRGAHTAAGDERGGARPAAQTSGEAALAKWWHAAISGSA
jgi:hypothetical protein